MEEGGNKCGQGGVEGGECGGCVEHMKAVIEASRDGAVVKKHGGPFGAAVVKNGKMISVAHNTVLHDTDPTCHAEVNSIRIACKILETNNLSLCEIYTSCEPCPMCWGAIQHARIKTVYVAVDREIALKYGFDDLKFYQIMEKINKNKKIKNESEKSNDGSLILHSGILPINTTHAFLEKCSSLNWKLHAGGDFIKKMYRKNFCSGEEKPNECSNKQEEEHIKRMQEEIKKILQTFEQEKQVEKFNKNLSPFGAVIFKNGQIVAECYEKEDDLDPTATVEVMAIRKACKKLQTYNLQGCCMYTTVQPDVLSTAAAMWARIDTIYAGIHNEDAAAYGYVHSFLQFKELSCKREERFTKFIECNLSKEAEAVFQEWQNCGGQIY